MLMEDALNLLDEMLDSSLSLPFSGGRCVIDVEKARDLIDDMRANMPTEIQRAEALLAERENIIKQAHHDSEEVIRKAEERARVILAQDQAVKAAQQKATQILSQAQTQAREMRAATQKFSDNMLKQAEESLNRSLEDVRATRRVLRGNNKTGFGE